MSKSNILWALFLAAVLLISAKKLRPDDLPKIPAYDDAPSFSLVDQSSKVVSERDFIGTVTLVNFIYTRCRDVCPILSNDFREIASLLSSDTDFRLISITVDPDFDTPDVLTQYSERFEASADRWSFLTGDPTEIKRVIGDFHVAAEPDGKGEFNHSNRSILVDKNWVVRGYYENENKGLIVGHMKALTSE